MGISVGALVREDQGMVSLYISTVIPQGGLIYMALFPGSYNLLPNPNLCALFSIQLLTADKLLAADTVQQIEPETRKLRTSPLAMTE